MKIEWFGNQAVKVIFEDGYILASYVPNAAEPLKQSTAETLKRISPLAWQHVDFYGRYRFDGDRPRGYGNPARRNWR